MIPPDTIYGRFHKSAQSQTDNPAILTPGKSTVTFGELLDFVDSTRNVLHGFGIGRGSRLGFLMGDRAQAAVAHLLATSTCTSVPLNPSMTADELRAAMLDMRIDAILVADTITGDLRESAEASRAIVVEARSTNDKSGSFELTGRASEATVDTSYPQHDDVAILLQTSGTTAKPKIAPQKQSNRIASFLRDRRSLDISSDDRCMNMMPMFHTQGLNAEFLFPIMKGASVVFVDFDPARLGGWVEHYRPTWFNLVPSMHQAVLAKLGEKQGVFAGSSLRFARSSSAKLPASLRSRLEQAYGIPLVESYGATECSNMATAGMPGEEFRPGSVGRPLHDGVVVADDDGNVLPPNEKGEICVTGPSVISGYENNPEATAESFRGDQYRTGDQGYIDEDGFLYVTGRIRDVVNRGGEKFSLAEVDDAILRLKGVAEGAAFSVPHEKLGHEIYAAVVLSPGVDATPNSLRSALSSHLSWGKMPKRMHIVLELPITSTGKVLRDELAQQLNPTEF